MAKLDPVLRYWMETWAHHELTRIGPLGYPSSTCEARATELHLTDRGKRTAMGKQTRCFMPRVPDYMYKLDRLEIAKRVQLVVNEQIEPSERAAIYCYWLTHQPERICAIALGLDGPGAYRAAWERATRKVGKLLELRRKKVVAMCG